MDNAFRLGKRAKEMRKSASPVSPKGDLTGNAFRLGKVLCRGYKKCSSQCLETCPG